MLTQVRFFVRESRLGKRLGSMGRDFGVGGLGQLAVQYSVAIGLHVIAIDIDPEKLLVAKRMGAEITINLQQNDVGQDSAI